MTAKQEPIRLKLSQILSNRNFRGFEMSRKEIYRKLAFSVQKGDDFASTALSEAFWQERNS